MVRQWVFLVLWIALLPFCLGTLTCPALAADYSLTSSSNYNTMFTGPPRAGGSSTMLGYEGALVVGDVNGDSVDDLVMAAQNMDYKPSAESQNYPNAARWRAGTT